MPNLEGADEVLPIAASLATGRKTRPAKRKRAKSTKKHPNGLRSRAGARSVVAKAATKGKAKPKVKGRVETVRRSPSAITGAKATATAGMQLRATSPMMARKVAGRESGRTTRRHYLRKR